MPATLHAAPRINTGINGWPESGAIKAAMKFVYLAAELYSAGDIWNNNARTVFSVIKSVFWRLRSNSLTKCLAVSWDALNDKTFWVFRLTKFNFSTLYIKKIYANIPINLVIQ